MTRTVLRKAKQDGIAERMNRNLNETVQSMRIHAGLPNTLWADAVNTAAYLINRGPSIPLGDKILEDIWSGKKVYLSFLHTFGCVAYVMINPEKRDKLGLKSKKCYFLSYGTDSFGYRVWDGKKVFRHCIVIFDLVQR